MKTRLHPRNVALLSKTTLPTLLVALLLPAIAFGALPGFMLERMGTMSGQVFVEDKPVANAIVGFFLESKGLPPITGGMPRIPEFISRLDSEGRFNVKLAAGRYYLGTILRDPAAGLGPPRPGENYYFAASAPGELRLLEIADRQAIDSGRIDTALPDTFAGLATADSFTVEGVVLDDKGAPFPEAVVLAKQNFGSPRPDFKSRPTATDGRFTLKLPATKQFFLIARPAVAGLRPQPGQLLGTYGIKSTTGLATPGIYGAAGLPPGVLDENRETADRALPVSGAKGEIVSGIEINMYAVPDPRAIKASIQGTPGSPKFETTGAALTNILFVSNSHQLDRSSFAELDRWVVFLKGREGIRIEISGHTDATGPAPQNLELSTKRAQSVAEYLIGNGIAPERVTVKGYGAERPVADNATEEGKRKNRRVEIQFIDR
ncbi:MAG: hypothetical protein A2521_16580 [Deltaproteobacteria bacterium RIFOXYD12_FULL_57_12]|nr:MAG: hypothetical protein A2521_16580 [Deltaproteobacteria bacterium RIFOXYD12_FULL_57_12]